MEEPSIDSEHAVQIDMMDLLSSALDARSTASGEGGPAENEEDRLRLLEQLVSYTEVHFMSEQLLMRQHSYEGFEAHDAEHSEIMDQLLDILARAEKAPASLDAREVQNLRGLLLNHIATQDRQLSRFLRQPAATA